MPTPSENKRKLKSTNVNDFIQNADVDAMKQEHKPLFLAIGGLVALGLGICGYSYFLANKAPEKTYQELAKNKTVAVKEETTDDDSSSKSFGFSFDKSEKEKKEPDRTTRIYTATPSSEIVNAPVDSGMVQLGDYMFTLPCTLSAFTDAGFTVYGFGDNNKTMVYSDDLELKAKLAYELIIQFDEESRYSLLLYSPEVCTPLNATVVSIGQNTDASWFSPNAFPMFLPGGVKIGTTTDSADAYYSQFDNYSISSSGYRILNGPHKLNSAKNNFIELGANNEINEIYRVDSQKNY